MEDAINLLNARIQRFEDEQRMEREKILSGREVCMDSVLVPSGKFIFAFGLFNLKVLVYGFEYTLVTSTCM